MAKAIKKVEKIINFDRGILIIQGEILRGEYTTIVDGKIKDVVEYVPSVLITIVDYSDKRVAYALLQGRGFKELISVLNELNAEVKRLYGGKEDDSDNT